MSVDQQAPEFTPVPSRCPAIFRNLWSNTKPSYSTWVRVLSLTSRCYIVLTGIFCGFDIFWLEVPILPPLLDYACMAFGFAEALGLLWSMRKPAVAVSVLSKPLDVE